MKKSLKFQIYAALVFLLVLSSYQARATHEGFYGHVITYVQTSPNTFQVYLIVNQACVTQQFSTLGLNIKAPGCNNGRTVIMNLLAPVRVATPYCSAQLNTCTVGQNNYREIRYEATVTFSPTEMACPDWVLSFTGATSSSRHQTQNIANSLTLYTEARLKLIPGMINSSPEFGFLPSPFVRYNQPTQINSFAIDPEGDSLVYSIQNPLEGYNTPIPYAAFPNSVLYNADSTKFSPLNGPYSNNYPLMSYTLDWSQPMPLFPVKKFSLDTRTGTFSFIPKKFDPNFNSYSDVQNRFAIVVQVDEYRKINGARVKIGTIRREMIYGIVADTGNHDPEITNTVSNSQLINQSDIIALRPGTPLNFQFGTFDFDPNDILSVTSDVTDILPGAILNVIPGVKPTATISWTPTTAHVRDQLYYFHLRVEDNACPLKGYRVFTYGVKVSNTGNVTGINKSLAQPTFTAFPNPFSEELHFNLNLQTKAESILIYNLLGQKIDEIPLKTVGLGAQKVQWQQAGKYAAGTYVARLISANKTVQTLKFTKLQ